MIYDDNVLECAMAKFGAERSEEADLWKSWKKSKDSETLGKLLDSFEPMTSSFVNKWSGSSVPDYLLRAKVHQLAVKAFDSYDPKKFKNVSLGTHVFNNVKRVSRTVYENQNVARVPEHRVAKIGTFQNVKGFLEGDLGREPTSAELSSKLGWSLKDVNMMENSIRKDLMYSGDLLGDYSKGDTFDEERDRDLIDFIYYELAPEEKLVYEYLTGKYGKPKLKATDIAQKLSMSDAKISRIRSRIAEKIEQHRG
jgi:DNA-directed RNA polymerase specialized sigma subunit